MKYLTICSFLVVSSIASGQSVRFLEKTKYLNNARAVVSHNIDDSTKFVIQAVDTMDKYGIKSTIFVIPKTILRWRSVSSLNAR